MGSQQNDLLIMGYIFTKEGKNGLIWLLMVLIKPLTDVNRGWTGNRGVRFGFEPRVEIRGSFWAVNSC